MFDAWWLIIPALLALLWSGRRLLVFDRQDRVQQHRLEGFRGPTATVCRTAWADYFGSLLSPIVGGVEQQRLQKLLAAAGLKHQTVAAFIAAKAALATLVALTLWASGTFANGFWLRLVLVGFALLLGWRAPDLLLNRLVARRRLSLEKGMPDALDLLVICAEAGLSLNQAIDEVSRRMVLSNRSVAEEFVVTSAEMRVLPDFGRALDNFVDRTGLEQLRGLIGTLKQTLQFGTPLAESLRTIAAEMRAERNAKMEERAARLPVLLTIPMMMFILPCLFIIIGTPIVLRVIDVFRTVKFGTRAIGIH